MSKTCFKPSNPKAVRLPSTNPKDSYGSTRREIGWLPGKAIATVPAMAAATNGSKEPDHW